MKERAWQGLGSTETLGVNTEVEVGMCLRVASNFEANA